jgi:hypothetical protein
MSLSPGSALAAALVARRGRYNALFADARRAWPALDPDHFAAHLRGTVAPIVDAVAAHAPAQAEATADALYRLSLPLVAQAFLGPQSRYPALTAGWHDLLVRLAPRVAEAPRRFAGAVTNALHQLALTPGARPADWTEAVAALSPRADGVDELLRAAQVAAWRAGLAHYRLSALEVCRTLPPRLAAHALGAPDRGRTPAELEATLARLRDDPWLDPAEAPTRRREPPRRLQLVRRVGAFRGFGGSFIAPPTVTAPSEQFVVTDGEGHWRLAADRFGATLHRTAAPPIGPGVADPPLRLDRHGRVTHGQQSATFPDLAGSHSSAADRTTLAATTPLSHAVFLVALVDR